jgi:hypothetical protein
MTILNGMSTSMIGLEVEVRRKLRRSELIRFFEKHEGCTVVRRRAALPIIGPAC